jgi:hypothetical protein
MSLLSRLFGRGGAAVGRGNGAEAIPEPAARTPPSPRQSGARRATVTTFGRDLAQVGELDLMGRVAKSPDGSLCLVIGSRPGDRKAGRGGAYAVIEDRELRASGPATRPSEGAISDAGAFVISDWLNGDALASRLLGFHADGSPSLSVHFGANLSGVGISSDGALAACQTLDSPGSPDSCVVALFDLAHGCELCRIRPECGNARSFDFDVGRGRLTLLTEDGDRETYGLDGVMVDREDWLRRRIGRGDLAVIADLLSAGSVLDFAAMASGSGRGSPSLPARRTPGSAPARCGCGGSSARLWVTLQARSRPTRRRSSWIRRWGSPGTPKRCAGPRHRGGRRPRLGSGGTSGRPSGSGSGTRSSSSRPVRPGSGDMVATARSWRWRRRRAGNTQRTDGPVSPPRVA